MTIFKRLTRLSALLLAGFFTLLATGLPATAQQSQVIDNHTIQISSEPITVIVTPTTNIKIDDIKDAGSTTSTLTITRPPRQSGPICGGANQKKCASKPAEFVSAALGKCPKGSFFDIGKWQCWSCPSGFKRTLAAVDSDRACSKPNKKIRGKFGKATFMGPVCPKGSFFDGIRGGECRKCPAGYKRSAAHVDARNACFVAARRDHKKVREHGKATGLLKTDCPKGQFWDAADGKCHSCPAGYKRSAAHVHSAKACFKAIAEKQAKAAHVKKGDCGPGEFRDALYQRGGKGGTCWTCPKAQDRTVFPVHGTKACEKGGGVEFKTATKKADLTCPSGQIFDFIGITKADYRTRPELKGKKVKTVKSGTCWTCPAGYDRTLSSVKKKDACAAKSMAWYSRPFDEPGLFGLDGVEDVLIDIARRHPALIADSIKQVALSASKSNRKLSYKQAWSKEVKTFTTSPQNSTAAAAAVLARVIVAAGAPNKASAAEKRLVKSFRQYIIDKRTHVAEDALAAYDAWKKADDYWRAKDNRTRGLTSLIDYGTVPPDFSTVAMMNSLAIGSASTAIGIATGSIPVLGDALGVLLGAAGNGFADFSQPDTALRFGARTAVETAIGKAVELAVNKLVKSTVAGVTKQVSQKLAGIATQKTIELIAKQSTQRLLSAAGSAGPQIIISVAFMIGTTAIDQVTEIANARPKLLNGIANAKYDPGMARLVKTEAGNTELFGYWSFLIAGEKKPSAKFNREFAKHAKKAAATKASK
tara:strand:- start:4451 stop:6727 length:2277 start_codon:yes stop_codon:yes gene_type:complete